jgi:hypothetical protein
MYYCLSLCLIQDLGYTVDYGQADPLKEPTRHLQSRKLKEAAIIAAGNIPFSHKNEERRLDNDVLDIPILEVTHKRYR